MKGYTEVAPNVFHREPRGRGAGFLPGGRDADWRAGRAVDCPSCGLPSAVTHRALGSCVVCSLPILREQERAA